jgi:hypothetical protein
MKTAAYASKRSSESSDWLSHGSQLQGRSFGPQAERDGVGGIDLLKGPLFVGGMPVRAKLTIGEPNDKYEQEADRVAEQVMSMPEEAVQGRVQRDGLPEEEENLQTKPLGGSIQREAMPEEEEEIQTKPLAATITPLVQREALPEEEEVQAKSLGNSIQREALPEEEEEPVQPKLIQREAALEEEEELLQAKLIQREAMPEEEEEVQTKPLGDSIQREAMLEEEEEPLQAKLVQREAIPEEEEEIQTKRSLDAGFIAESNLESRLSSSQGGGSPLPEEVRTFMEPRFGADFSQVRVHTGSEAVQMNRDLNAQAFAHGKDVYFGAGKAPGKDALTAHELTHVVQQTGLLQKAPKKASKFEAIKDILNTIPTGKSALKLMEYHKVKVVFKKGGGSYYNPSSTSMVIDSNEAPADAALTFVHEMNHARYDKEGITGKVKDQSRDDYVNQMVEEEAEGTVKSIEAKIELEGGGTVDVSKASFPLEKQYRLAHNAKIKEEEAKFPGKERSEVDAIKLFLPGIARNAGKNRVIKGFMDGDVVTSNTKEPYKDYYGKYWDKVNKKKK